MLRFSSFALLLALVLTACSNDHNRCQADCSLDNEQDADEPTAYELAFEAAQREYLDEVIARNIGEASGGLVHIADGLPPPDGSFDEALENMNGRQDTADFDLPALLTLLYRFPDSAGLDENLRQQIETALINFKYWPDELQEVPGTTDAQNMVTWTENHYILFASGAYLAGQLYPDQVFPASGNSGREQMEVFRPRIMKWLELRFRSGFSEWLSNVYYSEDMSALLALIELAEDEEIVRKSSMVLDLMFADVALNHFQGNFGSTHGRSFETNKMSGYKVSFKSTLRLAFLSDQFGENYRNKTTQLLALSEKYRLPEVIVNIANDVDTAAMESRQRMGIKLEDAANWGLNLDRLEDGLNFLTMEAYTHPLSFALFYDMLNTYEWWDHRDFKPFNDNRALLDDAATRSAVAAAYEWDITRNMRPEVNIYTYRTPQYMLSTAQDWRKGFGGDQASIWQATLGIYAVAFTTHPATESRDGGTPNYWTGDGTLPRAAQIKNVVMTLYDVETREGLFFESQPLYTHAFLPRARFDEAVKEGQWFFARKDDAYLALWSSDPDADWIENATNEHEGGDYDIIANGEKTIWICELGDADEYGDFAGFKAAIAGAAISADAEAMTVSYTSPSQGLIEMGWEGPVKNNGVAVQLDDYGRYENPWSQSGFPADSISFTHGDSSLHLDFDSATRSE